MLSVSCNSRSSAQLVKHLTHLSGASRARAREEGWAVAHAEAVRGGSALATYRVAATAGDVALRLRGVRTAITLTRTSGTPGDDHSGTVKRRSIFRSKSPPLCLRGRCE